MADLVDKLSNDPVTEADINTITKGVIFYNSARTYAINEIMKSLGLLFRSKANGNQGNTPISSPTQWKILVFGSFIKETSVNYTVLDDVWFTDIFVTTGGSDKTITLPSVASNEFRKIRIYKADSPLGKVNVTCGGSDSWENGLDALSLTIPLMTQGDNIKIIASNSTRTKWDIVSAASSWHRGFYTYGPNMSDNQDGTWVKREGFHVFLSLNSKHSSPPIPDKHEILELNFEFVQPIGAIETPAYNNTQTTPFIGITIFGLNQGNARKLKHSKPVPVGPSPEGNTAIGMYDWNIR